MNRMGIPTIFSVSSTLAQTPILESSGNTNESENGTALKPIRVDFRYTEFLKTPCHGKFGPTVPRFPTLTPVKTHPGAKLSTGEATMR